MFYTCIWGTVAVSLSAEFASPGGTSFVLYFLGSAGVGYELRFINEDEKTTN